MLSDERLDGGDRLRRSTTRELRLDEPFEGNEPQFLETLGLGTSPILVGKLAVGVAAPQLQRRARARCRSGGVPTPQSRTRVGEQVARSGRRRTRRPVSCNTYPGGCVTTLGPDGHPVDHPANARHVAPQGRGRSWCRIAGEHRIGQSVDGDHGVAMDQQHRQEPALSRPTDAQLIPVLGDGEPTQRVKFDHLPTPLDDPNSWRHDATVAVAVLWQPRTGCSERRGRLEPAVAVVRSTRAMAWHARGTLSGYG